MVCWKGPKEIDKNVEVSSRPNQTFLCSIASGQEACGVVSDGPDCLPGVSPNSDPAAEHSLV